ncbi:rRNA maturation RNase YbeY [Agathobaculum sp.]|uniref:rRNA maturation RNase YbeY n=1 Tax=Agathobaculum sp. TaxID=2048138 RepID=UPI003AF18F4B
MNHQIRIGFSTEVENEDEVRTLVEKCARNVLSRENVDFPAEIDITVVDADTIREMNAEYRSKDSVTDVLSFPMYEFYNGEPREELDEEPDTGCVMLGDMILCYTRACEQAKEFGHSAARECGYLTTHSMLHLLGYDHERNDEDTRLMRSKEEEYMNAIGLTRDA